MKAGGVGLLAVLAVVAVGGGWYFGTRTIPSERTDIAGGVLMFPDLAPKLRDATRIEISQHGKQTVIEKRADGGWGVASMRDYPVQEAKLRGVFTGLTELRLTEPRTSDPAEFSRLGVDDPNGAASTADLLRVLDAAGKPILAVIVGHRRVRTQANLPEEIYVRRPDENQSWLSEGSLQVDADAAQWLDRNVMNIAHDRIASVAVGDKRAAAGTGVGGTGVGGTGVGGTGDGGTGAVTGAAAAGGEALLFGRPTDGKFALVEPADHPKLEEYKVEDIARALELLTFQAVKADADMAAGAAVTEAGHSVFTTNDGLAVRVTVLHADKDVWARFDVSASSDAVKPEASRLASRLVGWSYQIGAWKEKSLVPSIDSLKAEDPKAGEAVKPGAADPDLK